MLGLLNQSITQSKSPIHPFQDAFIIEIRIRDSTKQTPQEKSTLSNILEQIKIVLVIYGIVIIIHMVSIGSKLPDLAKSTVVSFVVMASTYFGSAAISNIILSLKGMI